MSYRRLDKNVDADLLKAVVVDDDHRITDFFKLISTQYLSDEINLIGTYNSALLALNDPKLSEADVIFLDLDMPEVDGLQFMKQLDKESIARIVVISSKAEKFQFSGYPNVYGILPKPISISAIRDCILGIKTSLKSV